MCDGSIQFDVSIGSNDASQFDTSTRFDDSIYYDEDNAGRRHRNKRAANWIESNRRA